MQPDIVSYPHVYVVSMLSARLHARDAKFEFHFSRAHFRGMHYLEHLRLGVVNWLGRSQLRTRLNGID